MVKNLLQVQFFINLPNAIWQTVDGRQLTLYPDCAVLKNEFDRKSCCDK